MLLAALAAPPAPSPFADLILTNGNVWPGKGLPRAQALAVASGRVLAIGSNEAALAWKGPATRVVDLGGKLVLPGFNDAHVHFLGGGFGLLSLDLRPSKDEADMARRIGEYARTQPAGAWILGGRWDHESWPVKRLPSRASIDPVAGDHPVFVQRVDGHVGVANSRALALAGITRETPDPPGGTIDRDAKGEPTGILRDNAMELLSKAIPARTHEENLAAARAALAHAASLGVTSVQDNSDADALRVYQELKARGELTARVNVWRNAELLPDLARAGVATGLGDEWVRVGALKVLFDGSMGAGTAAFFEPYADDPKTRGLLLYEPAELERMVLAADEAWIQLAVHAIGDRANALVLDAVEKLVASRGAHDRRFRIEHAQVVRLSDLDRWKRLGVVASIQPSHTIDDMRWAEKRIGKARLSGAYNFRAFLDKGIPVAFGTDWSVEPLDPRLGLYAAVTREYPEGGPAGGWKPEEKLTLAEAIDLYTRGSAYAEGAEREKGTLEPGKLADLVVFAEDLFAHEKAAPRRILTAPVAMTVAGGKVVFEANPPR